MADSKNEKCSKMVCTLCRFTKLYSIELGKHITVGQLYRGLGLHTFGNDQQDLVQLSLAVDRRGKSRGLAFLRIPIMLEIHVLGFDGCLLEGKRLRFTQVKLQGTSRLKTIGWVRNYKTDPAVTLCHNRPLHFCHQPNTDPESDEGGWEPVFDVGARLFHGSLKDDLDTVLAKAYERGIRKINIPCYNVEQCEKAINLVNLYKDRIDIYFSAGIGPSCVNIWSEMNQTRLESMYMMDACSSVGLIGMDLRPETLRCTRKDKQLKVFEEQIKLACRYRKPVLVVEKSAKTEVISVLNKHFPNLPPCAIYCKSDDLRDFAVHWEQYIELGCYVVVRGVRGPPQRVYGPYLADGIVRLASGITKGLQETDFPTDRILIASDSPGLVIHDKFNTLNRETPLLVHKITDLITKALGRPKEYKDLRRDIYNNTLKFFKVEKNIDSNSGRMRSKVCPDFCFDNRKASRYMYLGYLTVGLALLCALMFTSFLLGYIGDAFLFA